MDSDGTIAIQRGYLALTARILAGSAPDSRLWERTGVAAAVVPSVPDQPMANRVVGLSHHDLVAALDDIAATYENARVRTWSVWVRRRAETRTALSDNGYRRAETMPAIALDLGVFNVVVDDLDYDDAADMATLGEINERAYPTGQGLSAALACSPPDLAVRIYQARHNGQVAAVVATLDQEHRTGIDCTAHWGATVPEARGLRLGPRLVAAALADARRRGCSTASGTASKMGAPVWAKLGWQTLFDYDIYEWSADHDA